MLPAGLSLKELTYLHITFGMESIWNENPVLQWPEDKAFGLSELTYRWWFLEEPCLQPLNYLCSWDESHSRGKGKNYLKRMSKTEEEMKEFKPRFLYQTLLLSLPSPLPSSSSPRYLYLYPFLSQTKSF